MRYRIAMSIEVDATGDRQAYEYAVKLAELLKTPLVRMAVEGEGIRLSAGDGRPIVHEPAVPGSQEWAVLTQGANGAL